jgi:predicted enzyme related to lactoylglutathione lyase
MSTTSTVVWLDIPVIDLKRAVAFYSAVLAAEVPVQSGEGFEMAFLPHGDQSIGGCLYVDEEIKPAAAGLLVYFNVSGRLDAAIEAATENGGKLLQGKHPIGPHGFKAVVLDSEGNRIALHSPTE